MTAVDALLAPMRELLAEAEPGPWFLDADGVSIYYVFHNGDTPDRDRLAESSGADAKLIAAAPETIARLLAAVESAASIPELGDRIHGVPEFIDGWNSALEEIQARLVAALGGTA